MAGKTISDKLMICIPQSKMEQKPVQQLMKLADRKDRSVNYRVVEAIPKHLKREEVQK